MIIGKSLTALGGGGLKPEIRVTAKAGALLNLHYKDSTIILQSYQLGASETTHTFVVNVSETAYVVEDATNSKSVEVLVDAVAVFEMSIIYTTTINIPFNSANDIADFSLSDSTDAGNILIDSTYGVYISVSASSSAKDLYRSYMKYIDCLVSEDFEVSFTYHNNNTSANMLGGTYFGLKTDSSNLFWMAFRDPQASELVRDTNFYFSGNLVYTANPLLDANIVFCRKNGTVKLSINGTDVYTTINSDAFTVNGLYIKQYRHYNYAQATGYIKDFTFTYR